MVLHGREGEGPDMFVHLVKAGETIASIGRAYGVSGAEIEQLNGWLDDSLVSGCSLLVPSPVPTTLLTYPIRAGDTLRKIANRFHMPEKMVLASNLITAETVVPGQRLTLPVPLFAKHRMEVHMRWEVQEEAHDLQTLEEAKDSISSVSIAYALAEEDGALRMPPFLSPQLVEELSRAQACGLLLLTMTDGDCVDRLLSHLPSRRAFFSALRSKISENGLIGLHLEMPEMSPQLRPLFNGFVRELSLRLKRIGCKLYLSVPAHAEDNPEHLRFGAYDLQFLCQHVDRLVWKADEVFGRLEGPPMAVAPLHLIERSLRYALTVVPRQKLLLGLPFFGYDWPIPYRLDRLPTLILHGHCDDEVLQPKQICWDDRAMSPMFHYRNEDGEKREVWYEDVRSLAAKLHLVTQLKLAGISCLVHGSTLESKWRLLKDTYSIHRDAQ